MVYLQFDYGEKYVILNMKRKVRNTRPTPTIFSVKSHARLAVTIGGSGGFLSFKNLINETNKCNNEDTYLDRIRICNVHWHRPPSVELEW